MYEIHQQVHSVFKQVCAATIRFGGRIVAQGRTAVSTAAAQDAKTDGEFNTNPPFPGTCLFCPQALGVSGVPICSITEISIRLTVFVTLHPVTEFAIFSPCPKMRYTVPKVVP